MKRFLLAVSCCWFGAMSARAQIARAELLLDRQHFIAGEMVALKVRIVNTSGQTLMLGDEPGWMKFAVEGGPNRIVSQRAPIPARTNLITLESSKNATVYMNLSPYFDFSQVGRYLISASIRIPQLKIAITSEAKSFMVVPGVVLDQQEFGVPLGPKAANAPLETRKYALLQASYDRETLLYFRLTDAKESITYRVFPIGTMVSMSKPRVQLDQFNNLHVLYQNSATDYLHMTISPDGVPIGQETYEIAGTHPALRAQTNGHLAVVGGARRYASTDLPPGLPRAESIPAAEAPAPVP